MTKIESEWEPSEMVVTVLTRWKGILRLRKTTEIEDTIAKHQASCNDPIECRAYEFVLRYVGAVLAKEHERAADLMGEYVAELHASSARDAIGVGQAEGPYGAHLSSTGRTITVECDDHDTKDALLDQIEHLIAVGAGQAEAEG